MQAIVDTITGAIEWLLGLVKDVFLAVWDFASDVISYALEQVLGVVVTLVGGISTSGIPTFSLAGLPDSMVNVLGLLGLGSCLSVIATAIGIRLAMQLIPFVRLGS